MKRFRPGVLFMVAGAAAIVMGRLVRDPATMGGGLVIFLLGLVVLVAGATGRL